MMDPAQVILLDVVLLLGFTGLGMRLRGEPDPLSAQNLFNLATALYVLAIPIRYHWLGLPLPAHYRGTASGMSTDPRSRNHRPERRSRSPWPGTSGLTCSSATTARTSRR